MSLRLILIIRDEDDGNKHGRIDNGERKVR
jgi:hypothetical protein